MLTRFDYHNLFRIKRLSYEIIDQFQIEFGYTLNLNSIEFLNYISESKTNDKVGTIFLKNSLDNLFKSLNLFKQFEHSIEDFILDTVARINHFESQGLEDDKIYFEQSLRSKSGVVLSSFHGVKGEEYAVVIAFGLLEGYIPHWNDIFKHDEAVCHNKASKLLFVICSRAKEKLYLFAETDRKTKKGKFLRINEEIENSIITWIK